MSKGMIWQLREMAKDGAEKGSELDEWFYGGVADEIERLREALRVIENYSNDHENARQIARQALGEDK